MNLLRFAVVIGLLALAVVYAAAPRADRGPFYKCLLAGVDHWCVNQQGGFVDYHEDAHGGPGAFVRRLTVKQAKDF